ncbi:hypothetical protein ADUPG1_006258 [Aduncisulcus paluster]|uniref:Uncharacterized protein n=1 Tax=Aduncisulcus paluster TaxID=2918883 RepID=A0ABQ5KJ76_9EUKA|nr:hypothetical protein ADUPG1_006258 [Aduncisulcus paluster]
MPFENEQGTEATSQSPGEMSAALETPAPEAPATETDSTPPSSSGSEAPAAGDEAPKASSLEDVIGAALDQKDPEPTDTPAAKTEDTDGEGEDGASEKTDDPENPSGEAAEDGATGEDADPDQAELDAMRPKQRKRVQQLLSQRNEARREVDSLKGDATNYQQIRTFMETNSLQDQEVAELFQLGADLKSGNPERLGKFLERVMPIVQQAMELTGQKLPADLQAQVEAGDMTEDAARTMSRTRTQAAYADAQAQRATAQMQQTQTQVSQAQITSAIEGWEQQIRQSDPDFDMKAQAMQRVAQAMVAERGLPQTPAQAVDYAKAAHAEVSKWMKSSRPAPKASRPAPTTQTAPRTGLTPAPTSLEAIIGQALDG